MAIEKTVTLFKGGTKEKTLPISQVEIPDLWHIAEAIRTNGRIGGKAGRERAADMILDCWHICGALKEHIQTSH